MRDKFFTNEFAEDTWNRKYRHNDESLDEWFKRVSGGNKQVEDLIRQKKFMFGGRILANRGLASEDNKVTYSNCFLKDTPVLTKEGYKPIQDVKIGDLVFTHNNRYMKVDNTLKREYTGELIKIKHKLGIYNSDVICTPNHKFLTKDNGWVEAKHLTLDDYIQSPIYKYTVEDYTVDLSKLYTPQDNEEIIVSDNKVYTVTTCVAGNGAISKRSTKPINRFITIDKQFRRLLGLFIADGSISKNNYGVYDIWQIVFNKKDEKYFIQWKNYCEDIFGRDMQIVENKNQHTLILRTNSKFLGALFTKLCGEPHNKYINESIADFYTLLGILDGDGAFDTLGHLKIQLASKTLADSIESILNKCNINQYTRRIVKTHLKETNKDYIGHGIFFTKLISQDVFALELNKTYEDDRLNKQHNYLAFELDNCYKKLYGIEVISNKSTYVYNLSVSEDNSYVVNNLVAHNCYVLEPPKDNIESIFDTAKELARTYSYGGRP